MARKLTALRGQNIALQADGKFKLVYAEPNKYPLIYLRQSGSQKILIAINPSGKTIKTKFNLQGISSVRNRLAGRNTSIIGRDGRFTIETKGVAYGIFECI